MFKYKGFFGSIETSATDLVLHGKIECISDLVTYEADTMPDLQRAFFEAVDDYIETCELVGKSPDKTMSGTFNIRIGEDLHRKAFLKAKCLKISLNDFVKISIEEKITEKKEVHLHFTKPVESSDVDNITSNKRFSSSNKDAGAWAGTLPRRDH
ncbi:type II toxin-antitoxin system HicB family antitoxin [Serratia fonticola]|uniref:type II toxin-antitoxin system HicB family antitoxin n=1 Tax=Serratia fonticola TaxID=47917 RepID=UPI0020C5D2D8|nr:type II toxin-antitoxin system HicB family antitoxin [Serratia fonticola]